MDNNLSIVIYKKGVVAISHEKAGTQSDTLPFKKAMGIAKMYIQVVNMSLQSLKLKRR